MSIDLHIHSVFSDGTLPPEELVRLAAARQVQAIAITDHDTIEGTGEAFAAGGKYGVAVISGIEFSARFNGVAVHVLGYGFDFHDSALVAKLHDLQLARSRRNNGILERLSSLSMEISAEELGLQSGPGQTGRPHFARIMVQKGWVTSMDEAFERFLGQDKPAYVAREILDAKETIQLIHGAGGAAVLAHPGQLRSRQVDLAGLVGRLVAVGLDGIEVYYPTHNRKEKKYLLGLARKHGLLVTGGSDYHGAIRPYTSLAGHRGVHVPLEVLHSLTAYLQKIQQDHAGQPGNEQGN